MSLFITDYMSFFVIILMAGQAVSKEYNDEAGSPKDSSYKEDPIEYWKSQDTKGCSATISCIRAGGHCVKKGKDCEGIIDPFGCRGKYCKCCIPDIQTTLPPPQCPTCKPCPTCEPCSEVPTTTAPTTMTLEDCPRGCFKVGSECFRSGQNTSNWNEAVEVCSRFQLHLAEPQDPHALSQYLDEHFDDASYWIGAHGTANDNAVWLSGAVIGLDAPWFANWYKSCDDPHWCMYLLANPGCYNNNQCLGCWVCEPGSGTGYPIRTTLCECELVN